MFFILGFVLGVIAGVFLSEENRNKIKRFFTNLGK
jgi:ABC-type phosphate transport system permease subunit